MRLSTTVPTRSRPRRAALALLGVTLALAACGDDDATTTRAPAVGASGDTTGSTDAAVEIEASRFEPQELTVSAGTTVEFVNLDPFAHTVTANDDGPLDFDSGSLGQDAAFEQTFDDPGTYDYFCEIHPTMRATVVVE